MNLVIDIGNTQAKAAIFFKNKIIALKFFHRGLDAPQLKFFLKENKKINSAILCSVVNHSEKINSFLKSNFTFFEFSEKTKLPLVNLYKTPKSLGKDRLANAAGANFLFPGRNVLSIDAGTCIKYDFVNSKNEYNGGSISPGFEMRFTALHQLTAKLPFIEKSKISKGALSLPLSGELIGKFFIGLSTHDSIFSGVHNGIMNEVSGVIKHYRKNFKNTIVIFTGGDSEFFKKSVSKKNCIFADPFLTLRGLNRILNFNIE